MFETVSDFCFDCEKQKIVFELIINRIAKELNYWLLFVYIVKAKIILFDEDQMLVCVDLCVSICVCRSVCVDLCVWKIWKKRLEIPILSLVK